MSKPLHPQFFGPAARAGAGGFTLVELLVAMSGGLFLMIAILALSRDATRFYQQETRIANATLSGATGMERLVNDIARAGYLTTPNIDADPRVCNRPEASWPAQLRGLRALVVDTTHDQVDGTEVDKAGIAPMAIELAGMLDVAEELTINTIAPAQNGGYEVTLRDNDPAAARLGLRQGAGAAAANLLVLQNAFIPGGVGRVVRITQLDGMEQYGIVTGVVAQPFLTVNLAATPAIQFRTSALGAVQCGIQGFNTGGTINVVNFVRYELRPLKGVSGTGYEKLFEASSASGLPYEEGRVELVRQELDPAGVAIAATREIVAEYAVDLQFSLLQATSASDSTLMAPDPSTLTNTYASTQLLRGVHVRLSVRSREADREAAVSGAAAGDIYRIGLGTGGGSPGAPFARVRTLQSDIPLRNLESARW